MQSLFFYNLMYAADFYKVSHKAQYPETVTRVHSTLVGRGVNYNNNISTKEYYWFGLKLFLTKLDEFEKWFFGLNESKANRVITEYKDFLDNRLGGDNDVTHWVDLWFLGELPITIHAVPERSMVEFQTAVMTVENTNPKFPWLTSFIESTALANIWGPTTAANRAYHIRKLIEGYMVHYTEEELGAVDFMGHDFSYRGMMGDEASVLAGCGHLAIFKGSDTIPAAKAMEDIYGEITGFSVPATEHSVMCAGGDDNEEDTYNRILDTYPTGIVSIVSDTWDYFNVLKNTLPKLKDRILARDGKVVIRPDSGNPVDIVTGTVIDLDEFDEGNIRNTIREWSCTDGFRKAGTYYFVYGGVKIKAVLEEEWGYYGEYLYADIESLEELNEFPNEALGSLEILGEVFGTTTDSAGRKLLNSKVGIIYGDGMNHERIKAMLDAMTSKGWSPLNIVFGIGAYTYQFMTRDELGWAFKATAVEHNNDGNWVDIYKDPKTDTKKKSLTGRFTGGKLEKVW